MDLDRTGEHVALEDAEDGIDTEGEETALAVHPSDPPTERDDAGRFTRGHRGRGGRPPGRSLTSVLKRMISPEDIVARLIQFATDPDVPKREQLAALGMIFDRHDGRPVSTTIMEVSTERANGEGLPPDYYSWSVDERREWLADRIRRSQ